MIDWITIRNEYINGNISYEKLSEKHGVKFNTLKDRATKDGWFKTKKEQQEKIKRKSEKKAVEKIASQEVNRLMRISTAADKLLEKIEQATEQLDSVLLKDKRKYSQKVIDGKSGKEVEVFVEEEVPKVQRINQIDKAGLRQLVTSLKDIRDIQIVNEEGSKQESPNINIVISAATADDAESDE